MYYILIQFNYINTNIIIKELGVLHLHNSDSQKNFGYISSASFYSLQAAAYNIKVAKYQPNFINIFKHIHSI